MSLEPRIGRPLVRPAEAEPAEGLDAGRQAQQVGQVGGLKERHPAKAEAGRAGGQPHVLDRAGAAPQVSVAQGRPAENPGRRCPPVAGDDDADRGLPDAVELEVEQPGAAIGGELPGLPEPLAVREQRGPVTGGLRADHDEPPRLRVPDRRRLVAGRQHLTKQVGGHRVGPEAADVTPRGEHRAQGRDRRFAERPAGRVDRPTGRRRGVSDQGNRARPGPIVLLAHRSATAISVTAVADSISAPNTSPVTPPSRRTACRLNRLAAASAMAWGTRTQPTGMDRAMATAAPRPRTPTVQATAAATGTWLATMLPKPDVRAARTPSAAPWTAATRPVAAATARTPTGVHGPPCILPSAATSAPRMKISVTTPNGPMSDCLMISSARAAGAPLPRPSAVSASPSRCRHRVSSASSATARTAPSKFACGAHSRMADVGSAATAPTKAPTTGSHSSALVPSPGCRSTGT